MTAPSSFVVRARLEGAFLHGTIKEFLVVMSYSDAVSGKVAIVGIGAAFPDSENKERYWSLIKNGKDAIRGIPGTHWSVEDYYSADPKAPDMTYGRTGGFIRPFDFDPMEFGITPNSLEAIDTSHILGLVAAREALEDGGYGKGGRDFPRESTGVIIGITGAQELVIGLGARLGHPLWKKAVIDAGGDEELAADVSRRIAAGYPEWQELSFPGLLGNVAAGRIANFFDLGGTNCVIDAACASSLGAIDMAYMELVTGRADVMLTGGVDTFNDIFMFMCFSKTPAMSPEGHAKPFSANGDGTCIGEGVGILMLKRLEDARRDGDRVYAVIEGIGSGSDGRGAAVFAPQSKGQAKAIRRAYLSSGINPHTVDLIEAHGTGTKVGDGIELSSLVSVFSEFEGGEGHVCALGSVKGQIGHCKAAAGVAGVIKAALSLYYKELPPTLRCDPPLQPLTEDDCEFRVSSENRPWISDGSHPRRAGVSAFGFGGTNFHCVLEEASPEKTEIDWADAPEIAVLSSDSPDGLRKALAGFRGLSWSDFRRAAFESRKSFDPGAGCVLSIVESVDGYDPASFEAKALRAIGEGASLPYSEGVFFSDFELKGATAFIFPGQGSQYPGMMRDSACLFPQLTSSLDLMERAFSAVHGKSLSEIIYPVARRALDSGFAQELTKTQHAQPALGAVALGNADVLGMFGVRADCAAGHSYGELAALCYSGMLARGDFAELSVLRGRLMGEGAGDRGSMCAVMAGYDALSEIIRAEGLDLTIANKNAPDQNVLSGGTEEILRAMKILDSRGITAKRLKVAAAFHSRFVSDAAAPFSDRISSVSFGKGSLPVYSNFTGKAYEEGSERLLLSSQLANPVLFSDEIEAMYNDGARLFIECGPRSGMCGLIKSILGGRGDFVALSADSSNGRRSSVLDMALLLARLASLGVHVDLSLWNPAPPPAEKPRFTVSVCGANYVRNREIPRSEKKYRDVSSSACPVPAASAPECLPSVERAGSQENTEAVRMIESMHARTAELHRQFLENQRMAFDSFRRMLGGSPSAALVGGSVDFPCTIPVRPSAKAAPDAGVGLPERTSPPSPEKRPVPPPAVPAPAPSAPALSSSAPAFDVFAAVAGVVAEKTGYPVEMLERGMDMESDLGVDSIKKVEIFSALRDAVPGMQAVGASEMGSIRTLGDAADAVSKGLPAPSAPAVSASSPAFDAFAAVAGVVAEKTGYPVEMLEHGMDMESDLGVDSIKKVEIFSALRDVVPGMRAVEASEMGSIRTLGDAARLIGGAPGAAVTVAEDASKTAGSSSKPSDGADLDRMILAMKPERLSSDPCFSGRIYLASPDASLAEFVGKGFEGLAEVVSGGMESIPEGVGGLVVVASATADELGFIEDAFRLERALLAAGGGLFATVSFMDGSFGLSGRAFERPVQGGLAGLAKTARQEYPSIRACAVDVDPLIASDPKTPGLVASAVLFGRSVEIGVGSSGLSGLEVERRKRSSGGAAVLPGKGDVVIVSGGGKGVTASCVIEFAESLPSGDKPCFALAGRTDLSHEEEPWLSGLELEKDVKKALMEHMESPSPAAIGRRCREIFTARAIRRTLAAVRAAGAGCEYVRADVCDPESVSALVKKARSLGRVSGFIHGAGVLADKLIADKTDPEFSRVFRTKAAGAMNVLSELSGDDLSLIVFFSSSTARFGRKGQVDYAAGNEVLNKIARREKALRPSCVVKAFNWGPWDGGMVNDGLKRLFASEGVGVIPLVEGGRFMASELASGDAEPEVVVIAGADGFDGVPSKDSGSGEKVVFEGRMSVADYPVLSDHVIGGMAVVPLALSAEIMAQAVLSANPGYYFAGYDDLRVESGIRLGGGESLDFVVVEGAGSASGGEILMPVSIRTVGAGGRMLRRVSCTMLLSSSRPSSRKPSGESGLPEGGGFPNPYGSLFHGSSLRGIESVTGISDKGIAVSVKKSPSPSEFMSSPLRSGWVTDFLASDCAFQMMILWTLKYKSAPSLPCYVRRMRRLAVPARGGMSVFARITGVSGNMVSADIVFSDSKGIEVAVIEGYECVCDPSLSGPFAENRLKA